MWIDCIEDPKLRPRHRAVLGVTIFRASFYRTFSEPNVHFLEAIISFQDQNHFDFKFCCSIENFNSIQTFSFSVHNSVTATLSCSILKFKLYS